MALLQAPTVEAAAEICGVSESTLSRWLKRSDFQDIYKQARSELVQRSLSSLQTASIEAIDGLKRNVACGLPAIEVRAASALLNQSLRATELVGIDARLDALECAVKSQGEHGWAVPQCGPPPPATRVLADLRAPNSRKRPPAPTGRVVHTVLTHAERGGA